jgi:hypothetical protein
MWFRKWFRGREESTEAVEPPPRRAAPMEKVFRASVDKPQENNGFDPYNTGSFRRHDAWERIDRR